MASINVSYDYMHLYRHDFRKTFRNKFPNIVRVGVDENVARFSRQCKEDTISMARARIVEAIRAKEGEGVTVEWHYGVSGAVIH